MQPPPPLPPPPGPPVEYELVRGIEELLMALGTVHGHLFKGHRTHSLVMLQLFPLHFQITVQIAR